MKVKRHIINLVLFILTGLSINAQTESELKGQAAKLFESEAYVEVTPLYLRLLSLNPKDPDYNFRYGTCLLFNSYQKQDAIRYLKFAVNETTIDPRAYYFYGKSLHLNYQFEEAKRSYQDYVKQRSKKDNRYPVERNIEMCENGKKLLSTFTDIIVSEKQEIDNAKFFRLYKNMQTIGGDILVTAEFQSKIDKKYGHVPIVHFPSNAKAIYYSSYGDDESSGKDIYVRRRLPGGSWGDPQKLPGTVNTSEDEDFPFMHASGDFLYFSSKGHNSMGGYDVFLARFNHESNSFSKIENVDFAISSPDDDLFYVVDSLHQNAYFASARQSQNGKLHVYRVRVARVPIQEIIVMGDFLSEVNPDNKGMSVKVSSHSNGSEVGAMKSNEKGKYSFVFPKGGKYDYEVTIDGSTDIYKFIVELPYLEEFRPLKQKAIHAMQDGNEIVRIVNLFDERVDGAESLMADVIRSKATLDVNVNNFDLKELDAIERRNQILAAMGFKNMSLVEVSEQLEELSITEKLNVDKADRIESNINNEIVEKAVELKSFDTKINSLQAELNQANDPIEKHRILTQISKLEQDKLILAEEIKTLSELKDETLASIGKKTDSGIGKVELLENQYKALLSAEKNEEALKLLANNAALINDTRDKSPDQIIKSLVEKSLALTNENQKLRDDETKYELTVDKLTNQIKMLNLSLSSANKKETVRIEQEIKQKENERAMVIDVLKGVRPKINENNAKLAILDNNIASLQKAMLSEVAENANEKVLKTSLEQTNKSIAELKASQVEEQLRAIEKDHPELNPDYIPEDITDVNMYEEIAKNNANEEELILANKDYSELEKENKLVEKNNKSIAVIDESLSQVETKLKENPSDQVFIKEKSSLNALKTKIIEENAVHANKIKELSQSPVDVLVTKESVLNDVSPSYKDDVAAINKNEGLSEIEKLNQLQTEDENLMKALEKENVSLTKQIKKNPTDAGLAKRKETLDQLKEQKQDEISERAQTVNALSNVTPGVDQEVVSQKMKEEFVNEYESNVAEIKNSDASEFEKGKEILVLSIVQLENLEIEKKRIEKELDKTPSDEELNAQSNAINSIIREQKKSIEEEKSMAKNAITSVEIEKTIREVDSDYQNELAELNQSSSPTKGTDIAERELALQDKIQQEITKKEKELVKKYDVTTELELAVLEKIIEESKIREAEARNIPLVVENKEVKKEFINQIREEAFGGGENTLTTNYTSKAELEMQEQILAFYEEQLQEKITVKTKEVKANPLDQGLQSEQNWLEEELKAVVVKRRQVGISIGELETEVVAIKYSSAEDDPKLNELNVQEQELSSQLNDPSISAKDKKVLETELVKVNEAKTIRKNVIQEEKISAAQKENEILVESVKSVSKDEQTTEQIISINKYKSEEVKRLQNEAEKAKTEEEKKFLLDEAALKQEKLNNNLLETIKAQKVADIEIKEDVSLMTVEELEKKRRTFSVQIGDLTTEILKKEEQIASAKKKELPKLEVEKAQLIEERDYVERQLRQVEERLLKEEKFTPVINSLAVSKSITFNEERQLAGKEEYENYYELATQALETERQITKLEEDLKKERNAVNELLAEPNVNNSSETIALKVRNIKEFQEGIDRLKIELLQQKYAAEEALPSNEEDAMNMQNLIARGIRPIKTTAVAVTLLQMPTVALAVNENTESIYSEANPIPVDVKAPTGLVYRVQIGAFAKAIPQDLFKEFNPVSGEKIEGTNVTRYMAGFFNNSGDVTNAREQIRGLGYSDAFVVAYCDGERIGFGEARRREAEGTCIPKGTNELLLEVATNTAEKLGIPLTNEVQELPELTYNQSPGAVSADPIEMKKGLFFTVQVGVFNRPVGSESIFFMKELITIRLDNGLIRYSSGVFNSVEEALPRRTEALNRGVKGAFVTAYYQGERISLSQAKRLLEENGNSILQSEIEKEEIVKEVVTPINVIRTDTVSEVNVISTNVKTVQQRLQIVTKKTFDEFPRDVLNRYNAEGNFFFDQKDGRVKSIIYKDVDDLPRLWNFKEDIDTLFLPFDEVDTSDMKILVVKMVDSIIPGDFMDWLLRFNFRREFVLSEDGVALRIFGVEPKEVAKVQSDVRIFALEALIAEENETEIDLDDN